MRFLGPVFWYDLVRVARRQPLALWRAGYGLALLAALFVLYATALPHAWFGGHVSEKDATAFANSVFQVFIALQFAAVVLLTPALAANAVAEERGHNTLTFLLTTHLTNREIVLGKLFTRLLVVGMLVGTGLPVLALVQFLGGVEPNLVIASFVALAFTALSLGGLGLFCGVFVHKHQNAAWRAYQCLVAFLALSFLTIWYFDLPEGGSMWKARRAWATAWTGPGFAVTFTGTLSITPERTFSEWTLDFINTPNPYYAHLRLAHLQELGDTLDQALVKVLSDYVIVHGLLAVVLGGAAVWRLRALVAKQSAGITHKKKLILRPAPHPKIKDRPVLWKELYCETRPRQRWLAVFFSRWFFVASFLPAWVFFVFLIETRYQDLSSGALWLLRYVGTFIVGLLCLRVALQAARSIGGERDRQTLDSLLTTQLRPAEIVRDKWWGAFLAGRWVFVWLLVHWCLGVLFAALHPLLLPVLVVETAVYAAFAAGLGMYCAARCRTTRQALAATLLIGLVGTTLLPWAGGKLAAAVLVDPPPRRLMAYPWQRPPMPWPEKIGLGLTPSRALANTVVPWREYYSSGWWYDWSYDTENVVAPVAFGLAVYALAAWGLTAAAARRFRRSLPGHAPRRFPRADRSTRGLAIAQVAKPHAAPNP